MVATLAMETAEGASALREAIAGGFTVPFNGEELAPEEVPNPAAADE